MRSRESAAFLSALFLGLNFLPQAARAADIEAVVKDTEGLPLKDAVVYAVLSSGKPPSVKPQENVTISQVDKQFVPYLTVIPVDTAVSFPNKDTIRHHVYSFSPAKKFDIPLYEGTPPNPVVFNKAGPVTLGCNIHDWMISYVFVLETPYYAKTEGEGKARLAGLPPGDYKVLVWHPRIDKASPVTAHTLMLANEETAAAEFVLQLKPEWRPQRGSKSSRSGYR